MDRPTPRELDALAFIRSRSCPSPSLGEIAAHLKVNQTRAATTYCKHGYGVS
jgi:hypothetical protein